MNNPELIYKTKLRKVIKLFIAVIVVILISGGFTGNHYKKSYKNQINELITKKDSIIQSSLKKEDSLIQLSNTQKEYADLYREQTDKLQLRNNNLYYELQKRNKQVFIVDTDFMSNARRISDGVSRFYKSRDTLR